MRLRAELGLLCLMLAGCQHLPDHIRVEADGRTIEVGTSCPAPAPAANAPR
jgi:starvation-inducible outer membrane lipoprotein